MGDVIDMFQFRGDKSWHDCLKRVLLDDPFVTANEAIMLAGEMHKKINLRYFKGVRS